MDSTNLHGYFVVLHYQRQLGFVYSTGCGKIVDAMCLNHLFNRRCTRQAALHPELHYLLCEQASAATAAEGFNFGNTFVHLHEVVAHRLYHKASLLHQVPRPGVVAGVVQRHNDVVVSRFVDFELALAYLFCGVLQDVHELKREGSIHRLHELPGSTPRVAALAKHDELGPQLLGCLDDAQVNRLEVVVAEEEPEVRGLAGVGAHRPVRTYCMEHLGDAYHGVGVGEEVCTRGQVEYLCLLLVHGYLNINTRALFYLLLQELAVVLERRLWYAQVVAVLVDLRNYLGDVLRGQAHAVEHFPASHGNLCLVYAVGAEHRAAPAL